jgi:PPK2 family polyphosphate:nucleotide phosphotransferase
MPKRASDLWRVQEGAPVRLDAIDPRSTEGAPGNKGHTKALLHELSAETADYQEKLFAEQKRSLLVVLQAIDAGGKDGTISHVFRGLNPQGVKVSSFKAPSDEELGHDFLWRVHKVVPRKGEVVVFNRSHYEDVLVVRVHELVPEDVWRPRYDRIREFEENLIAAGTHIVKLFLHISREEQAERLQARIDDPTKRWKFKLADLDERKRWDDYQAAFAEAIERTSTDAAPWYVIPADRKWYRNWAVSTILLDAFAQIDPQFPPSDEDLTGVVVV